MNKNASVAPKPTTVPTIVPTTSSNKSAKPEELRALTQKIAYELWEKKGRRNGTDVQDWLEAEKLARQRLGM